MSFVSLNWALSELEDPALQEVVRQLSRPALGAGSQARVEAFAKLLCSDSVVAQGIAFDHFGNSQGWVYGEHKQRILDVYGVDLAQRARRMLAQPARRAESPLGVVIEGANHASALQVLREIGTRQDLGGIAAVLATTRDVNVIVVGCQAADTAVRDNRKQLTKELGAALDRIIEDGGLDETARVDAVLTLGRCEGRGVDARLVEVCERAGFALSAAAGWALTWRGVERWREVLERVVARWPAGLRGLPASEVRRLLRDGEDVV